MANLFTYCLVGAPFEVMTRGRGAPGRLTVTLSKKGLKHGRNGYQFCLESGGRKRNIRSNDICGRNWIHRVEPQSAKEIPRAHLATVFILEKDTSQISIRNRLVKE